MQNSPMQNYPNGFESFPVHKMTLWQFFRHLFTAVSMMQLLPWKWARSHNIEMDLTGAWWVAGHALEMLDEHKSEDEPSR